MRRSAGGDGQKIDHLSTVPICSVMSQSLAEGPVAGYANAVLLSQDLLDAVETTLQCEGVESDFDRRAQLLATAHAVVDGWLSGRMSSSQAVLALRMAAAPYMTRLSVEHRGDAGEDHHHAV